MVFKLGVRHVDDVHKEIAFAGFIQGAFEAFHQLVGQFADEAHGITQQKGQVVHDHFANGGIKGGKQLVFREHLRLGQPVHQGGLAGIGVAHQSHPHQGAAVASLCGHLSVDGREVLFECTDSVANDPPVGLDFFFSWTLHADATFLLLKVGPHVGQPWQEVLVLGQFYLRFGMRSSGALGKDVEDQVGPVQDLGFGQGLTEVSQLRRTQLIIEYEQVDVVLFDVFRDFLEFALADKGSNVGVVQALREGLNGLSIGGARQKLQFIEVLCKQRARLVTGGQAHQDGPFGFAIFSG